jgi:hypothetical protein
MARDVNGNYTLHASNPVTTGQYVLASWANNTMSDLASEITGSLSRSGFGGMLAQMKVIAGTVSAPGLGFTTSTNSGLYWDSVNSDVCVGAGGNNVARFRADGTTRLAGATTITGGLTTVGGGVALPPDTPVTVGADGSGIWPDYAGATLIRQAANVTYFQTQAGSTYATISNAGASFSGTISGGGVSVSGNVASGAQVSGATLSIGGAGYIGGALSVGSVFSGALACTTLAASGAATLTGAESAAGTTIAATRNCWNGFGGEDGGLVTRSQSGTGDGSMAGITFHVQGLYATKLTLRHDGVFGVGGWSTAAWRWYVNCTTGDMTAAGNVIAYSDKRLKTDIVPVPNALQRLRQLAGVRYKNRSTGKTEVGLVADDVGDVFPELVEDTGMDFVPPMIDDGMGGLAQPPIDPAAPKVKALKYQNLTAVLVEALKEQAIEIEKQAAQIDNLKDKVRKMEKALDRLLGDK